MEPDSQESSPSPSPHSLQPSGAHLDLEEESVLASKARQGDEEAAHRLVEANLRFVTRVALSYRGRGLTLDDLISEGNMGLILAAHRFDPNRNVRFISYAVWWIRKTILDALNQRTRIVRLPEYQIRRYLQSLHAVSRGAAAPLPDPPTPMSVGPSISPSIRPELSYTVLLPRSVSIDSLTIDEHERRESHDHDPEQILLREEASRLVGEAVDRLPASERTIIHRRFGMDGKPPSTYKQIALQIGMSHERVRQIEHRVKGRLRETLESAHRQPKLAARRRHLDAAEPLGRGAFPPRDTRTSS